MKSCLLVDDSRIVRKVARKIFELFGFACDEADNGLVALEFCNQKLPDVVLLDWNMPMMDGLEFTKALRQLPGGDKPLVIFCTTENDINHIQTALTAGADEYIMKPFDADIIHDKLYLLGILDR